MSSAELSMTPEQRRANLRLGLILATLAAIFAIGFFVKIAWLSGT